MQLRMPRVPFLLFACVSLVFTCAYANRYLLMGSLFWQQLFPNNRTVEFELHTAWKFVSSIDGIRECQCTGSACGALPSPCSCPCSGNLGTPIVGDKMRSLERFDFGDNQGTSVVFTVMALDHTNDVLFAKAVLSHEYSFQSNSEYIAGFFYENRPSDIDNDPDSQVRILSNLKSSAFHMSADPADLLPGSGRLSLEMTKRGNSPMLSSSLPLIFDIPDTQPRSFSFPAAVSTIAAQHL